MKSLCTVLFTVFALTLLAPAAPAQKSEDCLACHSDRTLKMDKGSRSVSLFVDRAQLQRSTHASADCVDCHQGLNPNRVPHARVVQPVNCQACHDIAGFDKSVHGGGAACKDCHGTHGVLSPKDPNSPVNRARVSATCAQCHEDVQTHYAHSAHGMALQQGIKGAPGCVDCHGAHSIEPVQSRTSPVYKSAEAKMCLNCHLNNPDVRGRVGPSAGFIEAYESSVHGVALAAGNEKAATCSDCHGAHDMNKASNSTSHVNKWNISKTCGKCHNEIASVFKESIHGAALNLGNADAPSCTDCHGEHDIFARSDPNSRVAPKNVSAQVCATCHNSVQLSRKYGMAAERFRTFADSYHGLASRAGAVEVANCASCHGVHNIKASSDPSSTISKQNLVATCGQCHPGAGENFTKGSVHIALAQSTDALLYWVRLFYILLIVTVVGGMVVHNSLDFVKRSKRQIALRTGAIEPHAFGATQYLRMTLNERIQHATMLTSFIVLVLTGFMLRYPDAWWVASIRQISAKTFEFRGIIHRVAGVCMIGVSLYHAYYLAFNERGRRLVRDLMPKLQDMRDVWLLQLYNLGISKKRPRFGRFGYIEKAEYWALVWGVVIMGATGIILWFDNFFMNRLTKLGWDVARTVHFYEAVLATLAIVVWHFYYVIFNPSVYPMSTAWLTGKITEEEMADEHPLELERIREQETTEGRG